MIVGFVFSIFGFIYGIIAVVEKIINPGLPMGYTTMIVLVSVFSGIQLIALGMVGEYLGRMFMSQNKYLSSNIFTSKFQIIYKI